MYVLCIEVYMSFLNVRMNRCGGLLFFHEIVYMVLQTSYKYTNITSSLCDNGISSFPCAGVRFSLRGTPYQNNSLVTLEDIGEGYDALFCLTDSTACCRPPYTRSAIGNWFFPNGTRVVSSGSNWDFHRRRGQNVVVMHRRRGGEDGVYRCEIPDAMYVIQTIYIGVYNASTGKL